MKLFTDAVHSFYVSQLSDLFVIKRQLTFRASGIYFLIILSLIYEHISETTVCQVYHLSFDNVAKGALDDKISVISLSVFQLDYTDSAGYCICMMRQLPEPLVQNDKTSLLCHFSA